MVEMIAIPEHEYTGLIKRAECSIRAEFDSSDITYQRGLELIAEASQIGCSRIFINEMQADLTFIQ